MWIEKPQGLIISAVAAAKRWNRVQNQRRGQGQIYSKVSARHGENAGCRLAGSNWVIS